MPMSDEAFDALVQRVAEHVRLIMQEAQDFNGPAWADAFNRAGELIRQANALQCGSMQTRYVGEVLAVEIRRCHRPSGHPGECAFSNNNSAITAELARLAGPL